MDKNLKWAAGGAAFTFISSNVIPVLSFFAEKTPEEYIAAYAKWAGIVASLSPYLRIAAFGFVVVAAYRYGRSVGYKAGAGFKSLNTELVHIASPASKHAPAAPPEPQKPLLVSDAGTTVQELDLAIKEVVSALSEAGVCRDKDVEVNVELLRAKHPAWHADRVFNIRSRFLKAAEEAHAARVIKGSVYPYTDDYPNQAVRETHKQKIKNLGDIFRQELARLFAEASTARRN